MYLEVDRRDLAISLRKKLGDWFKVCKSFKRLKTDKGWSPKRLIKAGVQKD